VFRSWKSEMATHRFVKLSARAKWNKINAAKFREKKSCVASAKYSARKVAGRDAIFFTFSHAWRHQITPSSDATWLAATESWCKFFCKLLQVSANICSFRTIVTLWIPTFRHYSRLISHVRTALAHVPTSMSTRYSIKHKLYIPRRRHGHRHRHRLRLARHVYTFITSDTRDFLARIFARQSVSVSVSVCVGVRVGVVECQLIAPLTSRWLFAVSFPRLSGNTIKPTCSSLSVCDSV